MLCHLKGDGLCHCFEGDLDGQGVKQSRLLTAWELHIDDWADDSHDAARNSRCSVGLLLNCCSHN